LRLKFGEGNSWTFSVLGILRQLSKAVRPLRQFVLPGGFFVALPPSRPGLMPVPRCNIAFSGLILPPTQRNRHGPRGPCAVSRVVYGRSPFPVTNYLFALAGSMCRSSPSPVTALIFLNLPPIPALCFYGNKGKGWLVRSSFLRWDDLVHPVPSLGMWRAD